MRYFEKFALVESFICTSLRVFVNVRGCVRVYMSALLKFISWIHGYEAACCLFRRRGIDVFTVKYIDRQINRTCRTSNLSTLTFRNKMSVVVYKIINNYDTQVVTKLKLSQSKNFLKLIVQLVIQGQEKFVNKVKWQVVLL